MPVVVTPSASPVQAIEIIRPALRKIGAIDAIETPSAEQTQVALEALNGLIDTWKTQTSAAINNTELVVSLPPSTRSLTIGPGMDIDTVRPFRIESAYTRFTNIDRSVKVADKAEYDAINLKGLGTSWPELLWYDGGIPTGNVYFWPLASATVELHITLLHYLAEYESSEDSQYLPSGYKRALTLCLAVEMAAEFGMEAPATLQKQASLAYRAITRANQNVPELDSGNAVGSRLGQFLSGGF